MRWVYGVAVALGLACDGGPSAAQREAKEKAEQQRGLVEAERVEGARDKARNELRAKLTLLMADLGALTTQLDKAERALVAARTEDERANARQQVEAIGFQRERVEQRLRELELSTASDPGDPRPPADR